MSFIETERLILRTWMDSDLEALAAIYADPEVTRFLPGGARSREAVREWIDRAIQAQDRDGFSLWPVVRKSDHRLIGMCGFLRRSAESPIEIGFALEAGAWGQGLGEEAARAALDYGRGVLGLREVAALVDPRNRASVRLINRLGMRFDRVQRVGGREVLRYFA